MRAMCVWIALLAAASFAAGVAAQERYFGMLQVVAVHGFDEKNPAGSGNASLVVHEHHLHLRTKGGELQRLLFPVEPDEDTLPRSGPYIYVVSQPMANCTDAPEMQRSGAICVAAMMVHESAPKNYYARGQPRGDLFVKMLVVQLDICNMGVATPDWDALEGAMFDGLPSSQASTVEGMFKGCSFGMAKVNKAVGGRVLRVTVPIPCSGSTPQGASYDSMQCPFNEWGDVAIQWLQANVPDLKLSDYPHKVFTVMKGKTCAWGGMGYVGCKDDCRVWINGDLWKEPTTFFHEISHNLYCNHAGKWGNKGYEDLSGAMGYCCDIRCHNAVHSYQLGWAGPVKSLWSDIWPAGQWSTHVLPAAVENPKNFIKIWPDWSQEGAKNKLFIQYRKRTGWDFELSQQGTFGNAVEVYSALATDPQPYSSWEAGINAGQQWRETRLGSGVVVRVPRIGADGAEVRVCRASEDAEQSCSDGLDNDCDGRIDADDSDCANGGGGGGGGYSGGGGGAQYAGGGGGGAQYAGGGGGAPAGGGGFPFGSWFG